MKNQRSQRDVFLWLRRPVVAEMRAVLGWAHKHALRKDIRCSKLGEVEQDRSDLKFEDIVKHLDRKAKLFFRIIVRKGMNRLMLLDGKKRDDLLDICIHCVQIGEKYYYVNLYLSAVLLGQLRRKFSLSEDII